MAAADFYAMYKKIVSQSSDPRSKGWFLVDSPLTPFFIMFTYFMLVTRLGPAFMRSRQAFKLRPLILTYNVLQVCANLIIAWLLGRLIINDNFTCMELLTSDTYRNEQLPRVGWLCYMIKYVDLADTFFFILAKKHHLVTRLHLFHHISMVFAGWMVVKYCPSGVFAFMPFLNACVHASMYAYYFCALYFGTVAKKWKQLITTLQMIQFLADIVVFIIHIVNPWCSFPKLILVPHLILTIIFSYMFGQFYYNSYLCKKEE